MVDLLPNDGAPGEGDFVDPNVNDITGTAFGDTLVGASGPNTILGLGGVDSISGLGGIDVLNGGGDPDRLFGGTENDTLDSADNVADLVMDCGTGTSDPADVLNRDLKDINATGCEIVKSVGILKLAPAAITAEAGRSPRCG